jgi:hypothetical protein
MNPWLRIGKVKYKYHKTISADKYLKIIDNPQSSEFFRFKKFAGNYYWYVRIQR